MLDLIEMEVINTFKNASTDQKIEIILLVREIAKRKRAPILTLVPKTELRKSKVRQPRNLNNKESQS